MTIQTKAEMQAALDERDRLRTKPTEPPPSRAAMAVEVRRHLFTIRTHLRPIREAMRDIESIAERLEQMP